MRQTKKGQQWYFGMKAHIGVDVESGLVHTVTTTPANVGDVTEVDKLLHGQEQILTLFALSNLRMARRTLLASAGEVRL